MCNADRRSGLFGAPLVKGDYIVKASNDARLDLDRANGIGPYSVRDLLTTMFKRRALIAVVLSTVVALTMLVTLKEPRTYRVTATLLVNEARVEMPIAPTDSTQLVVNRVSEEDLNSEIEVLRSRKLIENVVEKLSIADPTASPLEVPVGIDATDGATTNTAEKELSPELHSMVFDLQRNLDISAVKRSNVLQVSYRSTDPRWTKRVVEALIDEYLKQRAERYQSPQAVVFFRQQMDEAEQRLNENQQALEDFVNRSSITVVEGSDSGDSLSAQKQLVMEQLADLEASLSTAEAELESQTQQVERLREMLQDEPERIESSSQLYQDAKTSEVERALMALQLERDRLLQDFKEDSRHVRDIDAQINLAEARLEAAKKNSDVGGTEANPVHLELKGDLLRAQVALEGTRAKVASLKTQLDEYRRKLEPLNDKAFALESLQRNVQTAEEDYLRYRKKHEEARISAAMDREKFINVTVAQPAQLPLKAEPRGLAVKLVLSMFLGFLGGVGLAFVVEEFLDRSFTTAEDVERRLGISHIASIPDGDVPG